MASMGLESSCTVITASPPEQRPGALRLVDAQRAEEGPPGCTPTAISMEVVAERLVDLRKLVSHWTAHMPLQPTEREDIVSDVMLHLLSRVAREHGFGDKSFTGAMVENVKWAVARHCEAGMRRREQEQLTPPEEIPEAVFEPPPCAAEQRQTITALFEPLSNKERELLLERYVLGEDSAEVAARHNMRPEAVTMCCSRARAKALQHVRRKGDVAFLDFAGIFMAKDQTTAPKDTRSRRASGSSGAPARRGAGRANGNGPEKRLSREGRKEGRT